MIGRELIMGRISNDIGRIRKEVLGFRS